MIQMRKHWWYKEYRCENCEIEFMNDPLDWNVDIVMDDGSIVSYCPSCFKRIYGIDKVKGVCK